MSAPVGEALGRYILHSRIATGGMGVVYVGKRLGPHGFARTVAIKRLHKAYAEDPEFVAMFLDEARLSARIHHPNVVPTLDVVVEDREVFLVMDYVDGAALSELMTTAMTRGERVPRGITVAIIAGVLRGLHAAHEAVSDDGDPLRIVHRDVSPQNILVGRDGVPRLIDFGIAKGMGNTRNSVSGELKGKVRYMAPEQLIGKRVSRETDVFSTGVVFWELLTGERLFAAADAELNPTAVADRILGDPIPLASTHGVDSSLSDIVEKALQRDATARWSTAEEMADALEAAAPAASASEVSVWLRALATDELARRSAHMSRVDVDLDSTSTPPVTANGASQVFFLYPRDADEDLDAAPRPLAEAAAPAGGVGATSGRAPSGEVLVVSAHRTAARHDWRRVLRGWRHVALAAFAVAVVIFAGVVLARRSPARTTVATPSSAVAAVDSEPSVAPTPDPERAPAASRVAESRGAPHPRDDEKWRLPSSVRGRVTPSGHVKRTPVPTVATSSPDPSPSQNPMTYR